ncbi:hypothetical protein SAMD00019534_113570 [Acytostelium subglobosum LB1]|uniref:hypothetical protein n=1 Tax=Acytostelium subglobosum LB1 TaxID=1410327 RepID=UPI000644CEA3|nr:hypothetical protein SAMD00019534_113570 [Acytostelium subglobosum LB1]GAM28181.1 hypothetical protein SAMD00019534_113570 [Acytostelium subglobosum LB1]|eukprot:XP_012748815.1 hypothetical protein SAMD00019534_113570 [Acytostelium subglobosum LB1]
MEKLESLIQQAELASHAEQYDEIVSITQRIIQMVPSHIESYNVQGHAYLMMGQPDKALSSFTNCRTYVMLFAQESDNDPKFKDILQHVQVSIAKSLSMLGQNDAATKLLESVFAIEPNQPIHYYHFLIDLYLTNDSNIPLGIETIRAAMERHQDWDPLPLCVSLSNDLEKRNVQTPQLLADIYDIILDAYPNMEEYDQSEYSKILYQTLLRRIMLHEILSPDTCIQRMLDLMHINPEGDFGVQLRTLLLDKFPHGSKELHDLISDIESNETLFDKLKDDPIFTKARLGKLVATMETMTIDDARAYLENLEKGTSHFDIMNVLFVLNYIILIKLMIKQSGELYHKDFVKFVEWLPGGHSNKILRQAPMSADPIGDAKMVNQRCEWMLVQLDAYTAVNQSSALADVRYMYDLLRKATAVPYDQKAPPFPFVSVHNSLVICLLDQKFNPLAQRFDHWAPFAKVKWDTLGHQPSIDNILNTLTSYLRWDDEFTPESGLKMTKQAIDANPEYSIGYLVHAYLITITHRRVNKDIMDFVDRALKLDRYRDMAEREYGQVLLACIIVSQNHNEQSIDILLTLLATNPTHKEALHSLAIVYRGTNMLDEAEQHITTRVLPAYPDSVHARITLAQCIELRGDRKRAQEVYQSIYDLGFESPASTSVHNRMIQEAIFSIEIKNLLDDLKEFVSNNSQNPSMPIKQAYDLITNIHIALKEVDLSIKSGAQGTLGIQPEGTPNTTKQPEYLITLDFVNESNAIALKSLMSENKFAQVNVYYLVVMVHTFLGKVYSTVPERSTDAIRHLRSAMSFARPALQGEDDFDKIVNELRSVAAGLIVTLLHNLKRYDDMITLPSFLASTCHKNTSLFIMHRKLLSMWNWRRPPIFQEALDYLYQDIYKVYTTAAERQPFKHPEFVILTWLSRFREAIDVYQDVFALGQPAKEEMFRQQGKAELVIYFLTIARFLGIERVERIHKLDTKGEIDAYLKSQQVNIPFDKQNFEVMETCEQAMARSKQWIDIIAPVLVELAKSTAPPTITHYYLSNVYRLMFAIHGYAECSIEATPQMSDEMKDLFQTVQLELLQIAKPVQAAQ